MDRWIDVTEQDIAAGVAAMIDDHHQLIEGAAGMALAAGFSYADAHPGSRIVVVSCGANVSSAALSEMLASIQA